MAPVFSSLANFLTLVSIAGTETFVSALNTRRKSHSTSRLSTRISTDTDTNSNTELHSYFGPQNCVSVFRSLKTGTCQLQTNCSPNKSTVDALEKTEFSFICTKNQQDLKDLSKNKKKIQKHSFGFGGFDVSELYDTEVQCDECVQRLEEVKRSDHKSSKGKTKSDSDSDNESDSDSKSDSGKKDKKNESDNKKKSNESFLSKSQSTVTSSKVDLETLSALNPMNAPHTEDILLNDDEKSLKVQEKKKAQQQLIREQQRMTFDNNLNGNKAVTTAQPAGAVSYGPENCITTWLKPDSSDKKSEDNEAGVCIVKTDCGAVDSATFASYTMGLIAVDKDGVPVRHLFGKNSFDTSEEFNSLIRATSCVGLDETAEAITLEAEVKALSKVTFELKDEIRAIKDQVVPESNLMIKRSEKKIEEADRERERAEERAGLKYGEKNGEKSETENDVESADDSQDSSSDNSLAHYAEMRLEEMEKRAKEDESSDSEKVTEKKTESESSSSTVKESSVSGDKNDQVKQDTNTIAKPSDKSSSDTKTESAAASQSQSDPHVQAAIEKERQSQQKLEKDSKDSESLYEKMQKSSDFSSAKMREYEESNAVKDNDDWVDAGSDGDA